MLDDAFWAGYTDRQPRTDAAEQLRAMLKPWLPDIRTVLEVGCNRGDNLAAFDCEVTGVEPNQYARDIASEQHFVVDAPAHRLPFPNDTFDLVFTVGVLIHVPPALFAESLWEIHRVSRRYVLAVEYDAPFPTPVDYRGVRAGIWKRPFGAEFQRRFPDLEWVAGGRAAECFDGCKWWLFEKQPVAVAA